MYCRAVRAVLGWQFTAVRPNWDDISPLGILGSTFRLKTYASKCHTQKRTAVSKKYFVCDNIRNTSPPLTTISSERHILFCMCVKSITCTSTHRMIAARHTQSALVSDAVWANERLRKHAYTYVLIECCNLNGTTGHYRWFANAIQHLLIHAHGEQTANAISSLFSVSSSPSSSAFLHLPFDEPNELLNGDIPIVHHDSSHFPAPTHEYRASRQ